VWSHLNERISLSPRPLFVLEEYCHNSDRGEDGCSPGAVVQCDSASPGLNTSALLEGERGRKGPQTCDLRHRYNSNPRIEPDVYCPPPKAIKYPRPVYSFKTSTPPNTITTIHQTIRNRNETPSQGEWEIIL
jgi:hypothetical protein